VCGSRQPALLAFRLPGSQVGRPVGVVQRRPVRVPHLAGQKDRLDSGPRQGALEPVAFHVGHVSHPAVQGHQRRGDRPALTLLAVKAVALEQQRGPVILQPALEHGPLGRAEHFLQDWVERGFQPWDMHKVVLW
jgi:hypothetical protein